MSSRFIAIKPAADNISMRGWFRSSETQRDGWRPESSTFSNQAESCCPAKWNLPGGYQRKDIRCDGCLFFLESEKSLAEGRGFEPPVGLLLLLISSQMPLTTQPPFPPISPTISHELQVAASSFANWRRQNNVQPPSAHFSAPILRQSEPNAIRRHSRCANRATGQR